MGLVEVFVLNLDLCDFVKSRPSQKVIFGKSQYLLEVEDRIIHVVHFLQSFCFVEVSFAQRYLLGVMILLLS